MKMIKNLFQSKNLNILKPLPLAGIIAAIGIAQAFGVSWLDYGITVIGQLRVTPFTIGSLVLAGGILWDSRK